MRIAVAITGAVFTLGLVVNAQETTVKSKTETNGAEAKTVSYTGCVGAGTETRTYVLSKAIPVTRTTESEGTTGTTSVTETSYMLVPGPTVEVQEHVGHKVEVTGTLVPAGDSKTQSKTKIEREDAPDTTVKETTKADNAMPRFSVSSIKDTGERCE
jgi:predicted extracellular nuclease